MLKRPKATDTEEDLLALQESFLSSGNKPSASVVSRAGEKRRQQPEEGATGGSRERDVVQLHHTSTVPEGSGVGFPEAARPPSKKKSKFRERAEQAKQRTQGRSEVDPFEEMERQDRHVTKILTEIQERDTFTVPPVSMAMGHTKHGFPTVHELDQKSISQSETPGAPAGQDKTTGTAKKSRSLFSQQFESHSAEYFGLEMQAPQTNFPTQRDRVEPIHLTGRTVKVSGFDENRQETACNAGRGLPTSAELSDRGGSGMDVTVTPAGATAASSSGSGGVAATHDRGNDGDAEVLKKQFASAASQTWERFVRSSLISGVGLESVNVSKESAREEVSHIHRENAESLSAFSEEELLQERARIKQALGPGVLSFLQSRRQKARQSDSSPEGSQSRQPLHEAMAIPAGGGGGGGGREQEGEGGREEREESETMEQEQRGPGLTAPRGWLHMDVMEKEKVRWMTDVSVHPQPSQGPREARFSLEGLLIPRDVSVPSHLGLHHHGDEPEAGGYTLAELLHLSRSAVLQQRVLSLQILARILTRSSRNEYAGVVEGSLVSSLLEAGLPALLRYLLDDGTDAVRTAAIQCIHGLLVSPLEEYLLDEYCDCHMGNMLPALRSHDQQPHDSSSHDESHDRSEEEASDNEIIQRDVIEGYLRMSLLPRLRYILEVCRPAPPTVTDSLQILARLSRHSTWAASQVINCPRLMKVVFDEFLPLSWSDDQGGPTTAHGKPQVAAMKLIQVICAAGKNLAAHLLSHHKLLDVILRYVVPHPTELCLPEAEAYSMATSALRVWRVLFSYGMGSEAFRDTYPVFLKWLQLMASSELSSLGTGEGRRVAALLAVAESVVHVAAITPDMLKIEGGGELPPPSVGWAHASGMLTPLLHALSAWGEGHGSGMQQILCISNLLHFVGSYYSKLASKLPECPLDVLQQIEALTSGVLGNLPSSSIFTLALQGLRTTSKLANPPSLDGHSTSLSSLPTFATLPPPPKPALYGRPSMQLGDFQQLLQPEVIRFSCTELLLAYVRLCLACVKMHKGVINKVTEIFSSAAFQEYLEAIVRNPARKCSCFEFGELYLLYCSVKLFTAWLELSDISSLPEGLLPLCHHATFRLLAQLPPGMEVFLYNLTSTVVLHPKLLFEPTHLPTSLVTQDINSLTLREHPETVTVAADPEAGDLVPPTRAILAEACQRLGSIRSSYLAAIERGIYTAEQLSKSRNCLLRYPLATGSLLLPPQSAPLLPADWVMLPIMVEYNRTVRSDSEAEEPSSEAISMVTHTLYFLLLLEHRCPRVLCDLPPSAKLARLMCVFLIGNDLFLEREIHNCLSALLRLYCREEVQRVLDFDAPVPGLASFYDFYVTLLKQYAAVSYGDRLFGSFVLLPLQQRFGTRLRRALWEEHPSVLRVLTLPIAQLPVSINKFLHPTETDTGLLELYMKAVATGNVGSQWSPVLYLTAVHHLHAFMFDIRENEELSPLQLKLLQGTLQLTNEETRHHLLLYSGVAEESGLGFSVAPTLSETMTTLLTSLQHKRSPPFC